MGLASEIDLEIPARDTGPRLIASRTSARLTDRMVPASAVPVRSARGAIVIHSFDLLPNASIASVGDPGSCLESGWAAAAPDLTRFVHDRYIDPSQYVQT